MSDDIKTADWAPGTLAQTRKNIGDIDESEAAIMAKKLGGQILYEKTPNFAESEEKLRQRKRGAIVHSPMVNNKTGKSSNSASGSSAADSTSDDDLPRRRKEHLPQISKKVNNAIDKLMMAPEYKIKPNYGFFNFIRAWQKNGTERLHPSFYEYEIKQMIDHMEGFITDVKTLIQIAPSTYKTRIVSGSEPKFKFLKMIANWSMQSIKMEYMNIESPDDPLIVEDLIPLVREFYKLLLTIYYYGPGNIPKMLKEIYSDEAEYPDSPKEKLSALAKESITEWLYLENQIIRKLYPLLMRMCSPSYEPYPLFFNTRITEILKFIGLKKFDLLLPEKQKPQPTTPPPQPQKQKFGPPQKGANDSLVQTGLRILNQLFPDAGFDHLDEHPDMYPYFQPLYKFEDGFNLLSPDNPLQVIIVLHAIIEDCLQGCRNIVFEVEEQKKGAETIQNVFDEWAVYREDSFERLYCEPLIDLVNNIYSQSEFEKSHIGKRTITNLLWQTTFQFLPNFKFDQLILEHPVNENKYKPLFNRTDFARKYLSLVVNECDIVAKEKGPTKIIKNPWVHYKFDVKNEVSKRIDVLLGAKNMSANTNANNANLLKYTLCFIAVLDWYINNPESPAYTADPMHIYRVSLTDGKPLFSTELRSDQNKLFAEAIRASYQKKAE